MDIVLSWLSANADWLFSGFGGAAALALLPRITSAIRSRGDHDERHGRPQDVDFRFFAAPAEEPYNHAFYDHFTDRIRKAKASIYITGDGFECADDEGRSVARRFTDAFRAALSRGVSVVRIQTRAEAHVEWAEMMAELMADYPDAFHLYVMHGGGGSQMSSVCVIDPEYRRDSVVEIMLSTHKLFGAKAADLAGTAVFVERSQSLARDLTQRILSLTDPDVSLRFNSPEQARSVLAGRELYFAFGSNMDQDQMVRRAPSAVPEAVGFLPNTRLAFNRRGSYRPGGVASIEPQEGSRVYGVVYTVSGADFMALDEAEDPEAYRRTDREVIGLDGVSYLCHVYEAIPEGTFDPDPDYLHLLVSAAQEAGLPKDYLEELEGLRPEVTTD